MKEAGGGDGAMVLNHLNMQLMTVDSSVEMKYMEILQEDDEEKRKEREDEVRFKTGPTTKHLSKYRLLPFYHHL